MKAQPCYHNGHGKRQPPALVSASTSNGAGDSGMEVALVGEGSLEPDETTGRWWLPSGAIVSVTSSGQCTFDPNSQFDSLGELGRTINRAAAGFGGGMWRRQLAYDGDGSGIRRRYLVGRLWAIWPVR